MSHALMGRRMTPPCADEDDLGHLEAVLRLAGYRESAGNMASALLAEGGSLGGALALSPGRMARLGIPPAVGVNLAVLKAAHTAALRRVVVERPLIGDLVAALDYLHATMAHLGHEVFRVLYLDVRRRLIRDEVMGVGTIDRCPVHPREIFLRAVDLAASRLVLVHNHPSGALEPSWDDMRLTERMVVVADVIEVRIDDHLIIAPGGHFSFRNAGLLAKRPASLEPMPPRLADH